MNDVQDVAPGGTHHHYSQSVSQPASQLEPTERVAVGQTGPPISQSERTENRCAVVVADAVHHHHHVGAIGKRTRYVRATAAAASAVAASAAAGTATASLFHNTCIQKWDIEKTIYIEV